MHIKKSQIVKSTV